MQRRHFRAAFVKLSACCNAVAYLAYVRGLNTGADKADRQFTPQNIRFAGTPKIGFMVLSRQYSDEERERRTDRGRAVYFPYISGRVDASDKVIR